MIFYFSGTGNSKGIARLAAEYLNDRAVDLVGFDPRQWNDHPEEILGFVFPIYAYAAPEMVLQNLSSVGADNSSRRSKSASIRGSTAVRFVTRRCSSSVASKTYSPLAIRAAVSSLRGSPDRRIFMVIHSIFIFSLSKALFISEF